MALKSLRLRAGRCDVSIRLIPFQKFGKSLLSSPMAPSCNSAIIAEIVRGQHVESCHLGHAVVADSEGQVLFAVGNHERPTFPRSALKPLQALAGIMSGTDHQFQFTDAELAVICGSHRGE